MLQKVLVNNFQWIEDTSQFNEDFMKSCNEESDQRYFLEVDVQYPALISWKKIYELHNDLPFLFERTKIAKSKSLLLIYMIKLNMLFI